MTDKEAGVARQEEENKTQRRLVKVGSTVEGKTGWDSETEADDQLWWLLKASFFSLKTVSLL